MNKITQFSIVFIVASVGLLLSFTFGKITSGQQSNPGIADSIYIDGIYYGEGQGFRPGLKVEVEISDNRIKTIKVVSHNEVGPQYWRRATTMIPKAIIKAQSTDVDAVGGATYTSRGIMDAVENALSKATKREKS